MTATPPPAAGHALAGWGARLGAYVIDIIPVTVVYVILAIVIGTNEDSFGVAGTSLIVYVLLVLAWIAYNWGYRQGATGQTIGKSVLGIAVVGAASGQPLGFLLSFARYFVHILDSLPCYLGFLWPLWDKENRTFADMILQTRVVKR